MRLCDEWETLTIRVDGILLERDASETRLDGRSRVARLVTRANVSSTLDACEIEAYARKTKHRCRIASSRERASRTRQQRTWEPDPNGRWISKGLPGVGLSECTHEDERRSGIKDEVDSLAVSLNTVGEEGS